MVYVGINNSKIKLKTVVVNVVKEWATTNSCLPSDGLKSKISTYLLVYV